MSSKKTDVLFFKVLLYSVYNNLKLNEFWCSLYCQEKHITVIYNIMSLINIWSPSLSYIELKIRILISSSLTLTIFFLYHPRCHKKFSPFINHPYPTYIISFFFSPWVWVFWTSINSERRHSQINLHLPADQTHFFNFYFNKI